MADSSTGTTAIPVCICGARTPKGDHSSLYLGERRSFCSGGCKREFDMHPWVYTFYVLDGAKVCATPFPLTVPIKR